MSSIVKEAIVQEVGDSWFTLKVSGTLDPTGMENISRVLRFFNENTKVVTERLLALATSSLREAQALTEVIFSELDAAGLCSGNVSTTTWKICEVQGKSTIENHLAKVEAYKPNWARSWGSGSLV